MIIVNFNFHKGAATLPTIMALTILILAVGLSIAGVTFTESLISAGQKQSAEAYLYAEAGARDALMKITRNKNYICVTTDCYSIDLVDNGCSTNQGCAKISVSAGAGSDADPKIITSKGIVNNYTRRVQVNVVFDASLNGEINLSSTTWQELTN